MILIFPACSMKNDIGNTPDKSDISGTTKVINSADTEKPQENNVSQSKQNIPEAETDKTIDTADKTIDSNSNEKETTPGVEENVPLEKLLSSLPNNDLASIKTALDKCKASLTENISANDEILRKFIPFYHSVIDNVNSITEGKQEYSEEDLLINGIRKSFSESGEFYSGSPDFLYENFYPFVSEGLKEYLRIERDEMKQTSTYLLEDAALSISWDELADRILVWEGFINRFPQYLEAARAKSSIEFYLWVYTASTLDNTPVFMHQNKSLNPGVKASYEKLIASNNDSKCRTIITEYYSILKKNNFVLTNESIEYLKGKSIDVEWLERLMNLPGQG